MPRLSISKRLRRGIVAAGLALGTLATAGCGGTFQLEQLPAPAGISGPAYVVTAHFNDIGNLTIGANVKMSGVLVGQVTGISTRDFEALVQMRILKKFQLDAQSRFEVRFTTPLGEDFVAAIQPAKVGTAKLADGAQIPASRTDEAPTIEDTFAAVSLLLNGGGLDKVHIIADELQQALSGRTGTIRDALVQARNVVDNLAAHTNDIDRALDGLKSLSQQLNAGTPLINQALQQFPDTLQVLAADTAKVRLLVTKVAALGTTVKSALDRSQGALLADFDLLRPTLDALRATEGDLIPTANSLIHFGTLFDSAAPGDYVNLNVTIHLLNDAPAQKPNPATANSSYERLLTPGGSR
jgi:phospholipid/cholesterol/gamma-HCH transport system substrate-binding protein